MTDKQITAVSERLVESLFSPLLTTTGTDPSRLRLALIRHDGIAGQAPQEFIRFDREGFSKYVNQFLKRAIAEAVGGEPGAQATASRKQLPR